MHERTRTTELTSRLSTISTYKTRECSKTFQHNEDINGPIDYSLAAKMYLEEQTLLIKFKSVVKGFKATLYVGLLMLIAGVVILNCGRIHWHEDPSLGSLELIVSIFLGQNILGKLIAIYTKVHNSLMRMTVVFWILQFMLFEAVVLATGSIVIAITRQDEINMFKMDFLLVIQFIELIRLILCFCKTRELTILSRDLSQVRSHLATIIDE